MATQDYSLHSPFNAREGAFLDENYAGYLDAKPLDSGQCIFDRRLITSTSVTLSGSSLRLTYFTSCKTETVNNVRTLSGSTAAGATPTLCRVGLYSVAANGDITLIASIANDTTLWASTHTQYTSAFSVGVEITKGERYAVGFLCVTAAAAPQLAGNNAARDIEVFIEPKAVAYVNSQSDLPSSVANASIVAGANAMYAALTP